MFGIIIPWRKTNPISLHTGKLRAICKSVDIPVVLEKRSTMCLQNGRGTETHLSFQHGCANKTRKDTLSLNGTYDKREL